MNAALAPLAALRQWILVKLVPLPNGKADKLPVDHRTGCVTEKGEDGAHNPAIWTDHAAAAAMAAMLGPAYTVGFVLTSADPFWCLDIDGALQADNTWSPLAQALCAALPGTMVEVSQSGRGLHVWGRSAQLPEHSAKNVPLHIELYSQRRFIAIGTGQAGRIAEDCPGIAAIVSSYFPPRVLNTEATPETGPCAEWRGPSSDDELLRRALQSRSKDATFGGKATFADLFEANVEVLARNYPADRGSSESFDRSSVDMACAAHLAFWTGKDVARIERLMRRSALARPKWDERPDYLVERTIRGACALSSQVLQDAPPPVNPQAPHLTPTTSDDGARQGLCVVGFQLAIVPGTKATLENVYAAITGEGSALRFAHDLFLEQTMVAGADGKWRPITDTDYGWLRADLGLRGFNAIPAEIARTAVRMAAEAAAFDSAAQWAAALKWDGVPRIDGMFSRYFGAAATPYARAVGAYLMTAAAGRVVEPGCQADAAVVLVGLQGVGKTSAVRALCPDVQFFVELDLHKLNRADGELARQLRGKLVGELAELRGLSGRDQESIKAWVSRRIERWRPLYSEFEVTYPRRIVFIGTTNSSEFLDDSTGERRWLPLNVGAVDLVALERDRDQLWAEGLHRFRAAGVAWREAEALARAEHAEFKIDDSWSEPVARWLTERPSIATGEAPSLVPRGESPFTLIDVARGALGMNTRDVERKDELRIGKILRTLGYGKAQRWTGSRNIKVWRRP